MQEELVNRLGGLSLPRKRVVRLTDHPDMTLDVYRGHKTAKQQQQFRLHCKITYLHHVHSSAIAGYCGMQLFFNPLYTGGLFHCYKLDESIFHFRGVWSILSFLFYFWWKILLANNVDTDKMSHDVASDLGLHCLPMTFYRFSGKNGLRFYIVMLNWLTPCYITWNMLPGLFKC